MVQKGTVAVQWSHVTAITVASGVGACEVQDIQYSKTAEKKNIKAAGVTKTIVYPETEETATFNVIPAAASIALALAAEIATTIGPGGTLTVTSSAAHLWAGTWDIDGVAFAASPDGETRITFTCSRFGGAAKAALS